MSRKRIDRIAPQSGRVLVSGEQISEDLSFVFADSAAADTQVEVIMPVPAEGCTTNDALQNYKIAIKNPSTITNLTVKVMTTEEGLGDCLLDTLTVPKAQIISGTAISAYEFLVGAIFCGGALKLVVSNDAVLGAGDGFTASARIREL